MQNKQLRELHTGGPDIRRPGWPAGSRQSSQGKVLGVGNMESPLPAGLPGGRVASFPLTAACREGRGHFCLNCLSGHRQNY